MIDVGELKRWLHFLKKDKSIKTNVEHAFFEVIPTLIDEVLELRKETERLQKEIHAKELKFSETCHALRVMIRCK